MCYNVGVWSDTVEYKVNIDKFDGPLDLLLYLIKEQDIDIFEISLDEITKQYLSYIDAMRNLNLDIASEYLVMAAELTFIKSKTLLPKTKDEEEFEEDPKQELINRLLEYKRYKEVTGVFKNLESNRKDIYTKEPCNLEGFIDEEVVYVDEMEVSELLNCFQRFLERKIKEKPLNTKITQKEYSVSKRSSEILSVIKTKKNVSFDELFDVFTKDYFVVTFLSILDLAKKQSVTIEQKDNFSNIYLKLKGSV